MKNLLRGLFLFILVCFFLSGLAAQQLPKPTGFVNDFAGVMKAQDVQAVESLAAAIKEKTGAELAIATVQTYAPYASIDEFSIALAESWGIGERGKDNGVLLVLSMTERKVRIEVGYGLEGAIPDSTAGRILDTAVIPSFRDGDFSGGLREGYRAIAAYVAKEKGLDLAELNLSETMIRSSKSDNQVEAFFVFIILILLLLAGKLVLMMFFSRLFRGVGGFGSGGSFGRSSGGGFGGFGGGGFGGGGSSRGF